MGLVFKIYYRALSTGHKGRMGRATASKFLAE